MASKKPIVKIAIQSTEKSLAGYTVLGDVSLNGARTLVLERPEAVGAGPRPKKTAAKKVVHKSTSFDPTTMVSAGVGPAL